MSEQSSSGGGTVVQQTNPTAALLGGIFQAQAAQMANQQYQANIQTALNDVNQNYQAALTGLAPTEQTGVQALDQLNQYMGLQPYMPQSPGDQPTLASEEKNITQAQINNYLNQNSQQQVVSMADTIGKKGAIVTGQQPILQWDYTGVGANDPTNQQWAQNGFNAWRGQNASNPNYGISGSLYSPAQTYVATMNTPEQAFNGSNVMSSIQQYLAQQQLNQDLPKWQTQENNYTQDQGWAQQYGTPLTAQQITDNITNQPGYQAQLNQGIQSITNSDVGAGYLGSGAILKDLMNYGQNKLSTYYGNTLNRLASIASAGQQSAESAAGVLSNLSNNQSSLLGQMASSNANSTIASGAAMANGLISANPQFSVLGGGSSSGFNLGGAGSAIGGIMSAFTGL